MDWIASLAKEARTDPLVRTREFALKYHVSTPSVAKALNRQTKRGILEKLADGLYLNKLAPLVTATDIVNEVVPSSYISSWTALAEWGLSSQNPVLVTCVTDLRSRKIKTSSTAPIIYRKINRHLFWGYIEKKSRYGKYKIAEPEKAILDWIYFHLKDGLPVQFDEIQFSKLSRSRLVSYAKKFPSTVMQALFLPMLEGEIVGLQP